MQTEIILRVGLEDLKIMLIIAVDVLGPVRARRRIGVHAGPLSHQRPFGVTSQNRGISHAVSQFISCRSQSAAAVRDGGLRPAKE